MVVRISVQLCKLWHAELVLAFTPSLGIILKLVWVVQISAKFSKPLLVGTGSVLHVHYAGWSLQEDKARPSSLAVSRDPFRHLLCPLLGPVWREVFLSRQNLDEVELTCVVLAHLCPTGSVWLLFY